MITDIIPQRSTYTDLSALEQGSLFLRERVVYLKTDESNHESITVVNLKTGTIIYFPHNLEVSPIEGTLTYTDR